MKVYIGQTRSRALIAELASLGFGEMTTRGELPPRRSPFAFDNGVFRDFKANRPFDKGAYVADLDRLETMREPDFIVAPDIVAGGLPSLRLSVEWIEAVFGWPRPAPVALVVQDGMTGEDLRPYCGIVDGIFVGGSLEWKMRTGAAWVEWAHAHKGWCHIGRVGTMKRVDWARRIGADSIDSCLPLWSRDQLRRFLRALNQGQLL